MSAFYHPAAPSPKPPDSGSGRVIDGFHMLTDGRAVVTPILPGMACSACLADCAIRWMAEPLKPVARRLSEATPLVFKQHTRFHSFASRSDASAGIPSLPHVAGDGAASRTAIARLKHSLTPNTSDQSSRRKQDMRRRCFAQLFPGSFCLVKAGGRLGQACWHRYVMRGNSGVWGACLREVSLRSISRYRLRWLRHRESAEHMS